MRRKAAVALLIIVGSLSAAGCRPEVGGIEYELDRSKVVAGHNLGWHDINFTNNSGQDLHEIHLTVTVIGEDGAPRAVPKYYAVWLDGQTVQVSLSRADSPLNVQKIALNSTCDEGA